MKRILLAAFLAPATVLAAAPQLTDFAAGYTLRPLQASPVQEVELPDAIYGGVLHEDLSDLRVFNAAGLVVPHALCPPAPPAPPPPQVHDQTLPVFELSTARPAPASDGMRMELRTSGGTQVQIVEPQLSAAPASRSTAAPVGGYVIDAREIAGTVRALRLHWESRDGASEVQVRVEGSNDLDRWITLVPHATLLRLTGRDGTLERMRIPLEREPFHYLRIERSDGGEPPRVDDVIAEVVTVPPAPESAPRFIAATEVDPPAGERDSFWFDSQRLAPVHVAHVMLPVPNMALRIAVDSRAHAKAAWQTRWSGDVSSVRRSGESVQKFGETVDRYWRLRVLQGAETLGGGRPALRLGYHPARLQFLTQGEAPFTLAYGSARAAPAPRPSCEQLSGQVPGASLALGKVEAVVAPASSFGGAAALTPLPPPEKPTPVRQITLWIVLVAGALALVAMALSLLKRLREPNRE